MLLAVLVIIAGIAFLPSRDDQSNAAPLPPGRAPRAATTTPGPQPGPAPPGKVWSVEHGHWHDINPQTPASAIKVEQTPGLNVGEPLTPIVGNVPQPPGPVPPGKVWSTEHGHWHDVQ